MNLIEQFQQAEALFHAGNFPQSRRKYEASLLLAQKLGDEMMETECYLRVALTCNYNDQVT